MRVGVVSLIILINLFLCIHRFRIKEISIDLNWLNCLSNFHGLIFEEIEKIHKSKSIIFHIFRNQLYWLPWIKANTFEIFFQFDEFIYDYFHELDTHVQFQLYNPFFSTLKNQNYFPLFWMNEIFTNVTSHSKVNIPADYYS